MTLRTDLHKGPNSLLCYSRQSMEVRLNRRKHRVSCHVRCLELGIESENVLLRQTSEVRAQQPVEIWSARPVRHRASPPKDDVRCVADNKPLMSA